MTCPAGITRRVTAKNAVIFGIACRDCPLRERCTTSKDGRTLHLHEHDSLLRAARADWAAGPELRRDYMTHRPHVERAIAQVATWRGRRLKLRYRGVTSNHAWLKRRTAAVNLQPDRQGPGPPRRRLGPGHLTSQPTPRMALTRPTAGPAASSRTATPNSRAAAQANRLDRPDGSVIMRHR